MSTAIQLTRLAKEVMAGSEILGVPKSKLKRMIVGHIFKEMKGRSGGEWPMVDAHNENGRWSFKILAESPTFYLDSIIDYELELEAEEVAFVKGVIEGMSPSIPVYEDADGRTLADADAEQHGYVKAKFKADYDRSGWFDISVKSFDKPKIDSGWIKPQGKPFAEINDMVRIDTQNMMWAQVKSFEGDSANVIGVTPEFGVDGYRGKITKRDIKERISVSKFKKRFSSAGNNAKKITDAVFDAISIVVWSRVWKREIEDSTWRKEYKITSQEDFEDITVILKMDVSTDKLYVKASPTYRSSTWRAVETTAKLSTANPKQVATWATKTWRKGHLAERQRRIDEQNAQRLDEKVEKSMKDLAKQHIRGWEMEYDNGLYYWSSGRSENYSHDYSEEPDDGTWDDAWSFARAINKLPGVDADVEQGDKGEVHVTVRK